MRLATQCAAILLALALFPAHQNPAAPNAWRSEVEAYRETRDAAMRRAPFSPLGLVHREYFDGRATLQIGSSTSTDITLSGFDVASVHATVDIDQGTATARGKGNAVLHMFDTYHEGETQQTYRREVPRLHGQSTLVLKHSQGFGIGGKYNLLYRADAPVRGAAIEVYDAQEPALREFRGLEFFAPDARYRVHAQITLRAEPPQVQLIDSAGQERPYFVYGDLRFTLDGAPVTMEVYSTTLDHAAIARNGFMLIFADSTSGKESYYAGRYLDIEGKLSGAVTVDFNLSRNPPCVFSPVFTCPFPRAQNRLPVAIRAGEKTYRGKTATPLKK